MEYSAASYATTCLSTYVTSVRVTALAAAKLDLEHPERNCIVAAGTSHGCITRSCAVLLQQAHATSGPDGLEEAEMSE